MSSIKQITIIPKPELELKFVKDSLPKSTIFHGVTNPPFRQGYSDFRIKVTKIGWYSSWSCCWWRQCWASAIWGDWIVWNLPKLLPTCSSWRNVDPENVQFSGMCRTNTHPQVSWPLKTGYFEDPTPLIPVQTQPFEGPMILRDCLFGQLVITRNSNSSETSREAEHLLEVEGIEPALNGFSHILGGEMDDDDDDDHLTFQ